MINWCWRWFNIKYFIFNFFSNCIKCFIYMFIFFGTCFKKWNSIRISQIFTIFKSYLSVRLIAFISNQNFTYVFRCMLLYLFHPLLYILKCFSIINCICHNYTHGTFIISLCYCFKTFLACCIPNLQFYSFSINFNCFYFKINSFLFL